MAVKILKLILIISRLTALEFQTGDVTTKYTDNTNVAAEFTFNCWLGIDKNSIGVQRYLFSIENGLHSILIGVKANGQSKDLVFNNTVVTNPFTSSTDTSNYSWVFMTISSTHAGGTRTANLRLHGGIAVYATYTGAETYSSTLLTLILGNISTPSIIEQSFKIFNYRVDQGNYTPGSDGYNPIYGSDTLTFLALPFLDPPYTKYYRNLVKSNMEDLMSGTDNDFSYSTNLHGGIQNTDDEYKLPSFNYDYYNVDKSFSFILHGEVVIKHTLTSTASFSYEQTIYRYTTSNGTALLTLKFLMTYDNTSRVLQAVNSQGTFGNATVTNPVAFSGGAGSTITLNMDYLVITVRSNIYNPSLVTFSIYSSLFASMSSIQAATLSTTDVHYLGKSNSRTYSNYSTLLSNTQQVFYLSIYEISILRGSNLNLNNTANNNTGYGTIGLKSGEGFVIGCLNTPKVPRYDFNGNLYTTSCTITHSHGTTTIANCYSTKDTECLECIEGYVLSGASCVSCATAQIFDPLTKTCINSTSVAVTSKVALLASATQNLSYLSSPNGYTTGFQVQVVLKITATDYTPFHIAYCSSVNPYNADESSSRQVNTLFTLKEMFYNTSTKTVYLNLQYSTIKTAIRLFPSNQPSNSFAIQAGLYDNLRDFTYNVHKNVSCKNSSSRKFVYQSYYRGYCAATCPAGYYSNTSHTTDRCYSCNDLCNVCTDYYTCTVCKDGYYAHSGVCLTCSTPCGKCTSNAFNCLSCSDPNFVLQPVEQYKTCGPNTGGAAPPSPDDVINSSIPDPNAQGGSFNPQNLFDANSISECEVGQYVNNQDGTCKQCPAGCTGCQNAIKCTSCSPGYYLAMNICRGQGGGGAEPQPMRFNENQQNTRGNNIQLNGCSSNMQNMCFICEQGYYLNTSHTCTKCGRNCQECTSTSNCINCIEGYEVVKGDCEVACQLDEYKLNSTCVLCSLCTNCLECSSCEKCNQSLTYSIQERAHKIYIFFTNDLTLEDIVIASDITVTSTTLRELNALNLTVQEDDATTDNKPTQNNNTNTNADISPNQNNNTQDPRLAPNNSPSVVNTPQTGIEVPYGIEGPNSTATPVNQNNQSTTSNTTRNDQNVINSKTDEGQDSEDVIDIPIEIYTNQYMEVYFKNCTIDYSNVSISVSISDDKALEINFINKNPNLVDFMTSDCNVDLILKKLLFSTLADCNVEDNVTISTSIRMDTDRQAANAMAQKDEFNQVMANTGSTGLILLALSFKQLLSSFLLLLNSIDLIDLIPLCDFKYSNQSAETISKLAFSFDYWFNYTNNTQYVNEFQTKVVGRFPKVIEQNGNVYANQISFKFTLFIIGFIILMIKFAVPKVWINKIPGKLNYVMEYLIGYSDSFILSDSLGFVTNYCIQYRYIVDSGLTPEFGIMSFTGLLLLSYGGFRTIDINNRIKNKSDMLKFLKKYEFFFPFIIPNYTRAYYFNSLFILRNILVVLVTILFHDTFYAAIAFNTLIQLAFMFYVYLLYKKMPTLPVFNSLFTEISILVIFIAFACHEFIGLSVLVYVIIFVYFIFSTFSLFTMIYSSLKDYIDRKNANVTGDNTKADTTSEENEEDCDVDAVRVGNRKRHSNEFAANSRNTWLSLTNLDDKLEDKDRYERLEKQAVRSRNLTEH